MRPAALTAASKARADMFTWLHQLRLTAALVSMGWWRISPGVGRRLLHSRHLSSRHTHRHRVTPVGGGPANCNATAGQPHLLGSQHLVQLLQQLDSILAAGLWVDEAEDWACRGKFLMLRSSRHVAPHPCKILCWQPAAGKAFSKTA